MPGGLDPAIIERAEQAVEGLKENFQDWLGRDMERMRGAFEAYQTQSSGRDELLTEFHAAAHDLKGLGSSFGYPLVTRISSSLCRFIEEDFDKNPKATRIMAGHVDAISAVIRGGVTGDLDEIGTQLAAELNNLVDKTITI